MRLIDADYVLKGLKNFNDRKHGNPHFLNGIETAKEIITNAPTIDAVPVVRCKDCIWWQDRQIQLDDGSCRDYMPDEPWSVTCDVGINIGSHCTKHGFDDESGSWFWAAANDYCSCGAKMEVKHEN